MSDILIGGLPLIKPTATNSRVSMIIWGSAGCGKTELASTAPGKKLWLSFDPDGMATLNGRDDIVGVDLSVAPDAIVERFKAEDPLGLVKIVQDEGIDTVVLDSMTNFAYKAVKHSILGLKGATIERPSLQGYGARNAKVLEAVKNLLRMTAKLGKNMIFIAHEDAPVMNEDGVVLYISIMLGGKLSEQVPLDLSEVWAMRSDGNKRYIAIRPCRSRKPMKTRMFVSNSDPEFEWKYEPTTRKGMTIAKWVEEWQKTGAKLSIPK